MQMVNIVTLKGICSGQRLYLSGFNKHRKQKTIPQYFTIPVDLDEIKAREKERQNNWTNEH